VLGFPTILKRLQ